jgi:glycosyltransferase involved in cell wall biosynthesis
MNNHFTILIPSYNCEQWVNKNISSVTDQKYQNFDIIYIDDNSTDGTYEEAQKHKGVKLIKNSFNKGKMYNLYESISNLREDTIVVILDGDDWLYDDKVLMKLDKVYDSDKVWMTNGTYMIEPSGETVSPKIHPGYWEGNIRTKSWEFSHLGTFRKKLFNKIRKKDFLNKQGSYWMTTSDQAIMWPMAEMCGPDHHCVIKDVLYVYNRLNPLSDDKVNRVDQLTTEKFIRSISPYERLNEL